MTFISAYNPKYAWPPNTCYGKDGAKYTCVSFFNGNFQQVVIRVADMAYQVLKGIARSKKMAEALFADLECTVQTDIVISRKEKDWTISPVRKESHVRDRSTDSIGVAGPRELPLRQNNGPA
jgi:hypothetical protein